MGEVTWGVPPPPCFGPRSPHWDAVRDRFVKGHPRCGVCGNPEVEVHHVRPFHLHPELELDPGNLVSLCRLHHWIFGHGGDWSAWVPDVRERLESIAAMKASRKYEE